MIKIKILIVDDEIDFCLLMESYFAEKDYEVFLSFTLQDGLDVLEKVHPDILFLDNNLPDGEGWQHSDEIIKKFPSLKINLISAYHPDKRNLNSKSNVRIWEKPISLRSLEEVF